MDYCIALSDKYNMIIVQQLLGWCYILKLLEQWSGQRIVSLWSAVYEVDGSYPPLALKKCEMPTYHICNLTSMKSREQMTYFLCFWCFYNNVQEIFDTRYTGEFSDGNKDKMWTQKINGRDSSYPNEFAECFNVTGATCYLILR